MKHSAFMVYGECTVCAAIVAGWFTARNATKGDQGRRHHRRTMITVNRSTRP